jgi:hypothetical protein
MGLMVDIETWGTRPGAAIRSIGAVVFNERSGVVDAFGEDQCFYRNVRDSVGTKCRHTVAWWSGQSDEAQRSFETPAPIREYDALVELADFCCGRGNVWANDPDFDCVILRAAYEAHGLDYPFAFWGHRSVRTALELGGVSRTRFTPKVAHNALYDAMAQAQSIQHVYSKLGLSND